MSSGLWIQLLGEFSACRHGVPLEGLHERHADEILACLSVQHGRFLSNETLLQRIGSVEATEGVIRQGLSQLRLLLGEQRDRLEVHNRQVRIVLKAEECDLVRFDQAGQEDDLPTLVESYRGRLLEGFDLEGGWLEKERVRRQEQFLRAARRLATAYKTQGNLVEAINLLKEYLKYQAIEEWAWIELMEAQAESQERLCALQTYDRCMAFFKQRSNLTPPDAMVSLANRLRNAPPRTVSPPPFPTALPSAGGAVPLGSSFYLVRPCDASLKEAISRRDSVVLLTGSRQTGKSSLLARGLEHARHHNTQTIITDFETARFEDLQTMEGLCRYLAETLAEHLNPGAQPESIWKPQRPPQANLDRYLHQHILTGTPLVWGLDGVDRLFTSPAQSEFFAMLRSWHEKRAFEPQKAWHHLTLLLACAMEAHLYVRDLNKSPFNVGTRIALTDFSLEQLALLNRHHADPLKSPDELARFYRLVGGHPFLIHRGLDEITLQQQTAQQQTADGEAPRPANGLENFLSIAALDTGPYGDHLRRLRHFLWQDSELKEAVSAVMKGKACPSAPFFRLRSAGLLTGQEGSKAALRCGLYTDYFTRSLSE